MAAAQACASNAPRGRQSGGIDRLSRAALSWAGLSAIGCRTRPMGLTGTRFSRSACSIAAGMMGCAPMELWRDSIKSLSDAMRPGAPAATVIAHIHQTILARVAPVLDAKTRDAAQRLRNESGGKPLDQVIGQALDYAERLASAIRDVPLRAP